MMTMLSGSLRLVLVAIVIFSITIPGYLNRSAWIILLATAVYTVIYVLGKWPAWKDAWRIGGARQIVIAVLTTLPIQFVVVAIFYLIGLGASMLFGSATGIKPLTSSDVIGVIALFVVASAIGSLLNLLDAKAGVLPVASASAASMPEPVESNAGFADETLELDIDPRPLTPETFYVSRGYWKPDAFFNALGGRGEPVVKQPEAADEAGSKLQRRGLVFACRTDCAISTR